MDALAERLDTKLREWTPEAATRVRQRVTEMLDLADQDALDLLRSRVVEQEVLDLLDAPTAYYIRPRRRRMLAVYLPSEAPHTAGGTYTRS